MKLLSRLVFALLLCPAAALAGPLEDGKNAFARQDYAAALALFRPLAARGDAEAEDTVGVMYKNGWGVKKDEAAAMTWWRKAAEGGNAKAQYSLGLAYKTGNPPVTKDYAAAARWFLKAAGQGSWQADLQLGGMYANGLGVKPDYIEAYMWYRLEMQKGLDDAHLMEELAAKMTREQIAEALRRASEWRPVSSAPAGPEAGAEAGAGAR
jgi:TPR repeat protein